MSSMSKNERRAALAAARIMADLSEAGSGTVILFANGNVTFVPSLRVIGTYNSDATMDRLAGDIASTLAAVEGKS